MHGPIYIRFTLGCIRCICNVLFKSVISNLVQFQRPKTLLDVFTKYFFLILNSEFLHLVQCSILFNVNDKRHVDGLILTENA